MPALSLASSKRMTGSCAALVAGAAAAVELATGTVCAVGAVCAAAMDTAPNNRRKRTNILFASRRFLLRCFCLRRAGQIDRRSGAQQHGRHAILRRALRSHMAAHADALFAAADPEPSVFLPHHRALAIQQRKTNRLVCGSLHKK